MMQDGLMVLKEYMEDIELEKNVSKRRLLEFCGKNKLRLTNLRFSNGEN